MSDWDDASVAMDAAIDDRLADTIAYSPDQGVTYVDIPGYVLPFAGALGLNEIDPAIGHRWRVKVSKTVVPTPSRKHRLQHPKLGAETIWRPAGEDPEDQGRYWIFDIQEVG